MAAKASSLELCCSVCLEKFTGPIRMPCSHRICSGCLEQGYGEKSPQECPVCKRATSMDPPLNRVLKNIVGSYIMQRSEGEAAEKCEAQCSLHGEKFLFFCEEDQEPLCVRCQTSKKHRNHQLCPVEKAARDLKEEIKTALTPMKQKLERCDEVKQECEKAAEHIRSQVQHTERQIKVQFEKLHQFLQDEEEARIAAVKEEEEQKNQMMKEKMENLRRHVSILSDNITAIEKAMDTKDITFLKTYKDTKRRAQCTLQDPELLASGALIDVAKHLGNLRFRVWEKMLGTVQYTPVTLDPNTAALWLFLSNGLTRVRDTERNQQLPDNPERFFPCVGVLGSEGFTSGKHSWEVDVGNKPSWDIGVAKESINRKGAIKCCPEEGFWVVALRKGEGYKAGGVARLTLEKKLQRIRVRLDYDTGQVSFFDASDMSHIYTFKDLFTERLFPYFNPDLYTDGSNPGALQVCPEKVSITVMAHQRKRP